MSFEKHSNFNKLANFSEVKFGENKPVLEVELNELQQIQNEARADIVRDSIPSGFVTLGDIDYDYCANNDNQIKLKTESIAYVNGYRITIPKDTIIEIGESDKVREDLVFLEVWKEAVNDIDTLTEYGGENNAVINNPIKDERYPVATSQRVALKYRIRHVADLNFNYSYSSATSSNLHPYIGWNGEKNFSPVYAMGGNNSLECPKQILGEEIFHSACKEWRNVVINDSGLWIAGLPETDERCTKERYKSIDGFVYAIPMFRLKRKPHVGLASPFEYKKIHNQLDPKKFAHLVGQENVEKVHSVDIKGNTYKNYILHNDPIRLASEGSVTAYATTKICGLTMGETYTFVATNVPDNIYYYLGMSTSEVLIPYTPHTTGGIIIKPFTVNTSYYQNGGNPMPHFRGSSNINAYANTKFLILKGDWSNKTIPNLDYGIQSLGENTNNSITVENNLVEEGTYVHELQNHILPTHPEVTHVTWGEDVVIPPEVEIELKNGEEVIQTITQLPVKLETTGEEKLHVKTMKGRTLVNIVSKVVRYGSSSGWCELRLAHYKPNTRYMFVIDNVPTNARAFYLGDSAGSMVWRAWDYQEGIVRLGNRVVIPVTCPSTQNTNTVVPHFKYDGTAPDDITNMKFMLIEGRLSLEELPKYFTGMKSVEAPSIKVVGKNLYTHQKAYIRGINNQDVVVNVPVSPNTTYTFDASSESWATVTLYHTSGSESRVLGGTQESKIVTFTTDSSEVSAQLVFYHGNNTDIRDVDFEKLQIQFVEGSVIPSYELGKLNELRTPKETVLRSLSQSVFDYIDFDTGVLNRKIGEKVLDSSISPYGLTQQTNGACFHVNTSSYNFTTDSTNRNLTMSDRFVTKSWYNNHQPYTMFFGSGHDLYFVLPSSVTTTEQVKEWFRDNPTTLNYVLTTQLNEKIGLSEDDYVGKSKVTYQLAEPLRKVGTYSDFIEGKTLYSNIGVEVFDGSENIVQRGETLENTLLFVTHLTDLGIQSNLIYSDKFDGTDISWNEVITSDKEFIRLYTNDTNALYIRILKSKLATQDVNGFKNWLQANPVTIYYVKANPMEIPLKEVSPLDVDFSLNRQFKRGYENYLKELPNGVKDVIENGKVTRNIARTIIDGTENWDNYALDTDYNTDTENTLVFVVSSSKLNTRKFDKNNYYCRTLNVLEEGINKPKIEKSGIWIHSDSSQYYNYVYIRVFKNWLPTPDVAGLKKWLNNNPLEILFEVQTPTTEELTEENSRYVPYMPLNSYVGSLYVADGINRTKFLTAFSPSEYEVQTYHRYFSNEFNVFEDTTLKKSPYGHKTYLEEVDGKYVEKFIAGLEKHEIEDLRHKVSLTGFDYSQLLQDSFLKLIKGELS